MVGDLFAVPFSLKNHHVLSYLCWMCESYVHMSNVEEQYTWNLYTQVWVNSTETCNKQKSITKDASLLVVYFRELEHAYMFQPSAPCDARSLFILATTKGTNNVRYLY